VITFNRGDSSLALPVFGYRQTFTGVEGKVLGACRDGTPGAVLNDYGKGKALLLGALPGAAYLKGAFPLKPFGRGGEDLSTAIYPQYNEAIRTLLGHLLNLFPEAFAASLSPVISSDPLVEVTLHRNPETQEYCVSLVNFRGQPVEELVLTVDTKALNGVTSAESKVGKIQKVRKKTGRLEVSLRLDQFEVVCLGRS